MKIAVVTTNKDKFEEMRDVLAAYKMEAEQEPLDLPESGSSLEEIAISKAKHAFSILKKPLIVDDSGIFFEAYNSFPGVLAKRIFQSIGYDGLLRLLDGKNRAAYYKSVVCYIDQNGWHSFDGTLSGLIDEKVHADARKQFPYDAIFVVAGTAVASMPWEKRIEISHRSKAVKKFAEWLTSR